MSETTDHKPDTDSTANEQSYEASIAALEKILQALESDALPLEASIKQFETGVKLIKHCQNILDTTEQKIKGLMDNKPAE